MKQSYPYTLLITGLFLASVSPAAARETPRAGHTDARIRTIAYDPNQVTHINGVFRSALQIIFSPYEVITHVALGDTLSWEVAPVGNILFLKPKERAHSTNLIVLTSVNGQPRTYQFELSTRRGSVSSQRNDTMFEVRFRYPEQERQNRDAHAAALSDQQQFANEQTVINAALDHAVIEGPRNLNYTEEGDSSLAPSEVSDNGEFTVMRFPGHQDIPAFFGVNADGSETIIAYDVRDDFVVIHQTAKQFRLRRGATVLCIYNQAKLRNDQDQRTGTASNIIDRHIKEQPDGARP